MHITALHLKAYGHFTGASLDFGRRCGLAPGLHVVYGHNEAGKSTTLRALSSVLYGYPHTVVDGFRHDARNIAIGIDLLAADGSALSFVRRRRGRETLTAADGRRIEEAAVARFLGTVSQDVFEKVFALDHRRLREHARALIADSGSLGFSLAEAGSGVAGLKAVVDRLKAERAGLFLAAGARPRLNHAIAEFTRLRREARQHTLSPAAYRTHENGILETERELARMRGRLRDIEDRSAKRRRIARNLPLRAEHRALTQRIAALCGVPELPEEFAQRRITARGDFDASHEDIAIADAAIADLRRRIEAIALDADVLARAADIANLAQRRPVIENGLADLPGLEAERRQLIARAAELLAAAELGFDPCGLRAMLPSALRRRAILASAEEGKALMAQHAALRGTADHAGRLLRRAQEDMAKTPEPPEAAEITRALKAADGLGDAAGDIARRTRAVERKTRVIDETLTALGLPPGPPAADPVAARVKALRALGVPAEKTELRYADTLGGVDRELGRAREALARLSGERTAIEQEITALNTAAIATEDDLTAARAARDEGWRLLRARHVEEHADRGPGLEDAVHRYAPDGRLADAYEAHVREADRVADALRERIEESTTLAMLRRRAGEVDAERARVAASVTALGARRDAVMAEWLALWPPGPVRVQAPGEMIEWRAERSRVLDEAAALEEERDAISERRDAVRRARTALEAAITAFAGKPCQGPPEGGAEGHLEDGLAVIKDRARRIIDHIGAAHIRYEKAATALGAASEQKARAHEEAGRIEDRIGEWTAAWREALVSGGLPAALGVEAATTTLGIMGELDGLNAAIGAVSHRIETVRAAGTAFAAALETLRAALPDMPPGLPPEVCRWLEERLEAARRAEMERGNLREQWDARAADLTRAREKQARSAAALEALCAQAGGVRVDELAEVERRARERREAVRERENIETRVREDGDGRDWAALFAECDEVPGELIAADLITLEAERADTEAAIERLSAQRGALQNAFDGVLGHNQAAALAQEAAAVQTEIEDGVEAYVDLTVQETLLRAAIEVYRDRNQGPILRRASSLFAALTDGAYTGLRADVEGGETVLIVEDAARGSLGIPALSDGTMDSLYLALRLAVVQEHNAANEPVPFIADDLLLNLDNGRAAAALRTLATLAASTQVLMFTHHAHMAQLARKVVPPALLVEHSLPPPAAAARGDASACA